VGEKKAATKAAAEEEEEDDIQIIENDPKKEEQAGRDKMDDSSAVSQVHGCILSGDVILYPAFRIP
jgi:hypothetical protein